MDQKGYRIQVFKIFIKKDLFRLKKLFILLLLFVLQYSTPLLAKQLHSESYYQEIFCTQKNGQSEVTMEDRTRCDCIFEEDGIEYATEVDFAKKKYQAVGQALHYSRMTGKNRQFY